MAVSSGFLPWMQTETSSKTSCVIFTRWGFLFLAEYRDNRIVRL
jgi:hypothetical protein